VDENDNYDRQRPTEVHERFVETNFEAIITIAQNELDEFTAGIETEVADIQLVGLTIVGSFLTSEFDRGRSDLDVYFIADGNFTAAERFCQLLRDDTSTAHRRFQAALPPYVACVDALDVLVADRTTTVIRSPSVTLATQQVEFTDPHKVA
jgi:hypothetical protein